MKLAAPRAAFLAALALVAGAAQAKVYFVHARGAAFAPKTVEVRAGDTVEWKNEDIFPHNILARDKSFASKKDLEPETKFRWVAKTKGSHPYFCTLHPVMTGTIVVK